MDEGQVIAALLAFAKSHPRVAAATALWLMLSLGWKAQPKEKRDEWAKTYPRPVGALRFALELLPDLLGAGRVLLFGVIRGMASRESVSATPERETQAPPPPSEPGYAEQWALGVVALASVVALVITGCAAGQTPVLSPIAPRVVSDPLYGTCVEVGGKLTVGEVAIAQLSRTCLLMDASVAAIDASPPEPEPAVIPDKTDAGSAE